MICTKCRKTFQDDAMFCPYCGKKQASLPRKRTKSRGNGTGTAFRRGSTWTAQVVVKYEDLPPFDPDRPENALPRKKITRSKSGFKTRDAALQYCPILKAGPQKPKESPTLQHYWDTYEAGSFSALGKSRQATLRSCWKKLSKIYDTHMDQLTVAELQKLITAQTYSVAKDCKSILIALFRIAAAEGYVRAEIPALLQLPPVGDTEDRTPFSETEQAALWKRYEGGDRWAAAPLLMIYTGMMPSEAIALNVENIDLQERKITGVGMKTKVRKKTPVVLAEDIIPLVEDLIAHAKDNGQIWPTVRRKTWYQYYYDTIAAAGCRKLSPYCCRHTTATALAVTEGIAPQTVRKVMRWSNSRMLDRYAHPDQADALAAVDSIKKAGS